MSISNLYDAEIQANSLGHGRDARGMNIAATISRMTDFQRARQFVGRAMHLRCPECGVSPVFVPVSKVRSLFDWLTPLDGCPRCGYAYRREPGYFLIAICVINYGLVCGLGITAALVIDSALNWPMWKTCLVTLTPMPILSVLVARHAKALWLAIDHFFDPHKPRHSAKHV